MYCDNEPPFKKFGHASFPSMLRYLILGTDSTNVSMNNAKLAILLQFTHNVTSLGNFGNPVNDVILLLSKTSVSNRGKFLSESIFLFF